MKKRFDLTNLVVVVIESVDQQAAEDRERYDPIEPAHLHHHEEQGREKYKRYLRLIEHARNQQHAEENKLCQAESVSVSIGSVAYEQVEDDQKEQLGNIPAPPCESVCPSDFVARTILQILQKGRWELQYRKDDEVQGEIPDEPFPEVGHEKIVEDPARGKKGLRHT